MAISRALKDLATQAQADFDNLDETPEARMLFQATVEVLLELAKSHDAFVNGRNWLEVLQSRQ